MLAAFPALCVSPLLRRRAGSLLSRVPERRVGECNVESSAVYKGR